MATYSVRRTVDAFVDEVCQVEAENAVEAVRVARQFESDLEWTPGMLRWFDARRFVAVDPAGNEMEDTATADF